MTEEEIETRVRTHLRDSRVIVRATTPGGDHFEAVVASPAFEGRSRVVQHRMVYEALGDAFSRSLHALALRTMTPEQFIREFPAHAEESRTDDRPDS